ncbi:MAG: hypothetical protein HY962_12210 [Ignavibacteriae bacterium]|nr:hypothetical protein [Ignavibacteriota bacterium]
MDASYMLKDKGRFGMIALGVGIAGAALSAVGAFVDSSRFFLSYQVAFVYWVTLALGGLFFTMLQHATGAVWSVVVRRGSEALAMTLPLLFVFFLPMIGGIHSLFHWSHADAVAQNAALQGKAGYLNTGFFIGRAVLYFAVWTVLAWLLNKHSKAQDSTGAASHSVSLRNISAGGLFLFAFTLTFAAFDWLMSLDPHWYSTIFGVYVFVGGFLASIAFLIVFYLRLRDRGVLTDAVGMEHFHDFGRLLFAFTVFWAYIGGSQYFLIWYANIPEETVWYLNRWDASSWRMVSILLIALHFAVPFITLAFYAAKRNLSVLRIMALLLLVMHYVDMYWLVMPSHAKDGVHVSWMDVTTMMAIGGFVLWFFHERFAKSSLLPLQDPKLQDSIAHRV